MSEADCSSSGAPSLAPRSGGSSLDKKMSVSGDTLSEGNLDRILSPSARPDTTHGGFVQVPSTSTPDLSVAASSSPYLSPIKDMPSFSLLPTRFDYHEYGDRSPPSKPTINRPSFIDRLDYFLREAVEQQCHSGTRGNWRIQRAFSEDVCRPKARKTSTAFGPFLQYLSRPLTGDVNYAPSLVSGDLGYNPRKRKAVSMTDRASKTASESLVNAGSRLQSSNSYLSESDCASPLSCRYRDFRCPPFKKRKCFSFDGVQVPITSACAESRAFSKVTKLCSKSVSFPRRKNSCAETACNGSRGAVGTARSHPLARSISPYPPTEPATRIPSPVPILAPQEFPEAYIPRMYASSEVAAEARLRFLLEKEVRYRQKEGPGALLALNLAPRHSFVMDVMKWILTVEPPLSSPTSSKAKRKVYSQDLHEQLTVNHDSRFLAAFIFTSFFFTAPTGGECLGEGYNPGTKPREGLKDYEKMVVWDYAVASIALAVKIHRDYLPPLKPIHARHFLALAPHEMSFDDFKLAERDLLEYFSYDLGMPTPQAFLDEFRLALPMLRHALEAEHIWEEVLRDTWEQLLAAAHSPDMLRFPVSWLTATALIEGITRVVEQRTCAECARTCNCHMHTASHRTLLMTPPLEDSPTDKGLGIHTSRLLEDILTVLGLSVEKAEECRNWLTLARSVPGRPVFSKYFRAVS